MSKVVLLQMSYRTASGCPFPKVLLTQVGLLGTGGGAWEGNETSSFIPRLPARSLLTLLLPGEGAPSLFSPALCSGEPGAPPAAEAEVARASRQVTTEEASLQSLSERVSTPLCPVTNGRHD